MTTKKRTRSNRQMGILKVAIAAGSLAASLLGTNLLAKEANVVETASTSPITIDVPISLSPKGNAEIIITNPSVEQGVSLELAPIPEAVSPQIEAVFVQPVTSSKSSK